MSVTRFLFAILLALSLASAPGPALAGPSHDCPMAGASSGMADHETMDCCTPDCALACLPAAALPSAGAGVRATEPIAAPSVPSLASALPSISPAAIDPPPRTGIS